MKLPNPFYSNHVFKEEDLDREELTKWQKFWLMFLPTYVQFQGPFIFHYKRWFSKYFLTKVKRRTAIEFCPYPDEHPGSAPIRTTSYSYRRS